MPEGPAPWTISAVASRPRRRSEPSATESLGCGGAVRRCEGKVPYPGSLSCFVGQAGGAPWATARSPSGRPAIESTRGRWSSGPFLRIQARSDPCPNFWLSAPSFVLFSSAGGCVRVFPCRRGELRPSVLLSLSPRFSSPSSWRVLARGRTTDSSVSSRGLPAIPVGARARSWLFSTGRRSRIRAARWRRGV